MYMSIHVHVKYVIENPLQIPKENDTMSEDPFLAVMIKNIGIPIASVPHPSCKILVG